MVAVARARVAAAMMAVAVAVGVTLAAAVLVDAVAVQPGGQGGDEEGDDVHDAKGEAGLEHGAALVGAPVDADARAGDLDVAEVDGPVVAGAGDVGAVGPGDAAQEVDGGDEGAEEEGVDEGDEAGVARRAVVEEEAEDGPRQAQRRHDEEDEDRVGRQRHGLGVLVYKPAEHAHGGNLVPQEKNASALADGGRQEGRGVGISHQR
jgi:hypothetical protein